MEQTVTTDRNEHQGLGLDFSFEQADAESAPKPTTITISIQGGVIRNATAGIPEGIRIVVLDYDVENVDERMLMVDEAGDDYVESVWR